MRVELFAEVNAGSHETKLTLELVVRFDVLVARI